MQEATACFPGTVTSVRSSTPALLPKKINKKHETCVSVFPFYIYQTLFVFSSSDSFTQEAQDLHFVRALEWICDMMGCATSQASLLKGTSHCGETAQTELLTDLSISPALHRIV